MSGDAGFPNFSPERLFGDRRAFEVEAGDDIGSRRDGIEEIFVQRWAIFILSFDTGDLVISEPSSFQRISSISMRSMTPSKVFSLPMGIFRGTGFAPSFVRISCSTASKSAPSRSILLI